MRKLGLIALAVLVSGCAWFRDPPEQRIAPGATLIYNGSGFDVFRFCDQGNLVYLTQKNPQVAVIRDGCNPNVGGPLGAGGLGGPAPAAIKAASEVTLPALPQPFLIQLVPAPPPTAAVKDEATPPVTINVFPGAAPDVVQELPVPKPAPKPAPKAAPKGKPCPC